MTPILKLDDVPFSAPVIVVVFGLAIGTVVVVVVVVVVLDDVVVVGIAGVAFVVVVKRVDSTIPQKTSPDKPAF